VDPVELRRQFPVFEEVAYLNAGTCGPLPAAALRAAADTGLRAAEGGRGSAYFEQLLAIRERLRAAYAGVIGAEPGDVSLTTATSDGLVRVLAGLGLGRGDEVVTAPDEHPGLLGPLAAARDALGIDVRTAPFERLHEAVGPATRLVACSHVSWVTGAAAPAELAEVGREVPVLLDGAQGVGAIPVDVSALGCAFYAASGQKWLCGPVGTGLLWVAPEWRERLAVPGPTYMNLDEPAAGLAARAHADGRALDAPALSLETLGAALAAHDVLAAAGWPDVLDRAASLAAELADDLTARGRTVASRDRTTLVSWEDRDAKATVERLGAERVTVRDLPGTAWVRASVGAWNDRSDLDRLLAAI
jgi:L-cysteine/cystine lyase